MTVESGDGAAPAARGKSLDETRKAAVRSLLAISWAMFFVVAGAAVLAGNSILPIALSSAVASALGTMALRADGATARSCVALSLVAQAIILTAAMAGHSWQVDTHMVYFAALAALIPLIDILAVLLAAALIVVHHLSLSILLPALIFPSEDMWTNVERVLFHGAVVIVEVVFISFAILTRHRLDSQGESDRQGLADAGHAARLALTNAELARSEALDAKNQAETAAQEAIAATTRAEAEALRASEADLAARKASEQEAAKRIEDEQRLKAVVDALRVALYRLSNRNLTARIEQPFEHAYEDLRRDFNKATAVLFSAMEDVFAASQDIGSQTNEIANATEDLSRRTEAQAASLAQIASTVVSLLESVQNAASFARVAHAEMNRTHCDVEATASLVMQAVEAMNGIERSSVEIRKIIQVIDEIAFQTNLLALNAGVEAARAGDAGRGFAVVASEVRSLAQRASDAALDIKSLIETSGNNVKQGVEIVSRTGEALSAVLTSVGGISGQVSAIANVSQEQSNSLGQITSALKDLDRVTQQNAALSEETTAASQNLRAGTQTLVGAVAGFIRTDLSDAADQFAA